MKVLKFLNENHIATTQSQFDYTPYLNGKKRFPKQEVVYCESGWHGCKPEDIKKWLNRKVLVVELENVEEFDDKVAGTTGRVLPELTIKAQELIDEHIPEDVFEKWDVLDKGWAAYGAMWGALDKARAALYKAWAAYDSPALIEKLKNLLEE
uniref:Uncharacterized protein n=1 Tax=viral metagenome TaxID=1070528 RepID=A0A6H1ZLR3_9ZZZZ